MSISRIALGQGIQFHRSDVGSAAAGSAAVESTRKLQADLSYSMGTERRVYREDQAFRDRVRNENTLFVSADSDLETQQMANAYVQGIRKFIF